MPNCKLNKPTKHTHILNTALNTVGVETHVEYFDGHKCVDIFIPKGNIYIEIDGMQHYTSAFKISTDFTRDHYSDNDGFHTLHIPNEIVEKKAMKIARAIKKMLNF